MLLNSTWFRKGRNFRIGLFAVLAVILLAGAAYVWGSRLNADILTGEHTEVVRGLSSSVHQFARFLRSAHG